jgi:hypothetical protein
MTPSDFADKKPFRPQKRSPNARIRDREMMELSSILPAVSSALQMEKMVEKLSVLQIARTCIANDFSPNDVQVLTIHHRDQHNILEIWARNATVASQAAFQTEVWLEAVNGFSPQTGLVLHGIQWRVGRKRVQANVRD